MTEKNFPKLYNYKEAAEFLNLAESTLRIWMCRKYLPHFKIGKKVRFSEEHLQQILSDCEVKV